MAIRASGTPRIKIKNLPRVEPAVYSTVPLNDLVVFSAHYLQEQGIAITVEEMVSICFRLFPQSFSLQNYPRWPDSALVIRRLNDCREKGLLRGSSLDGFELKFKGQKLAERTAKTLGLLKSTSVKKKMVSAKPKAVRIKVAVQVKKIPAVKKAAVKLKPAQVKQKAAPKPAPQKHVVTSSSKGKKTTLPKQKNKPPRVQPVQMKMVLPTKVVPPTVSPAKQQVVIKRKSTPAPQLTKLQAIQPEIIIPAKEARSSAPQLVVSKEEKVKAEKIVRAMERSDAYKIYARSGHGSKLSEFDFRNMLFATMESTPETLIRNVNLFKGSAAIHNRQDLIKFLDFCEVSFSNLLKPTVKKAVKKK